MSALHIMVVLALFGLAMVAMARGAAASVDREARDIWEGR